MENYEDKYKKAFKRAKENYHAGCLAPALLEYIFPELKEGEDELIWLTNYIEEEAYNLSMDIRNNEDRVKFQKLQKALAWIKTHKYTEEDLDKAYKYADKVQYMNGYNDAKEEIEQKYILNDESKSEDDELTDIEKAVKHIIEEAIEEGDAHNFKSDADMLIRLMQKSLIKPKFNVGDWIIFYGDTLRISEIIQESSCYRTISTTGLHNSYDWSLDNTARLWTIADAKDGDVLVANNLIVIFAKSFGDGSMMIHSFYDPINEVFDSGGHLHYTNVRPATMEESAFLLKQTTNVIQNIKS